MRHFDSSQVYRYEWFVMPDDYKKKLQTKNTNSINRLIKRHFLTRRKRKRKIQSSLICDVDKNKLQSYRQRKRNESDFISAFPLKNNHVGSWFC